MGRKKKEHTYSYPAIPFLYLDPQKHAGPQMKYLRENNGIPLREIADKTGIDHTNVWHWENGSGKAGNINVSLLYAAAFNIQELRFIVPRK